MFLTGLLQAAGVALICVFFNVMIRVANLDFNIEPIVVASVSTVAAALVLSLFAGPGKLVSSTLKTPATWIYGVSVFGAYIIDVYLTKYVTATEMSLLSRMAIPCSILISVLIFKRKQSKGDLLGVGFVVLGLIWLFALQESSVLPMLLILAAALGLTAAGEVIASEVHTESAKAHELGNMRDKARVIGFVSVITSLMFLVVAFIGGVMHQYWLPDVEALSFLPPLHRFVHGPSIWVGLFYGTIFIPLFRYLLWSASYKIKSDNVLAIFAFIPLLTFASEWLLSFTSLLDGAVTSFSGQRGHMLLAISAIITFGSGLSVYWRVRKRLMQERTGHVWTDIKNALCIKEGSIQAIHHAANAMDDYEIICATLEHTQGDKAKAAALLEIAHDTLYVLHKGKGSLALTPKASTQMARRFRNYVANRDPLTGLYNRGGFLTELKKALQQTDSATLVFIDLNKFKPVNDTYGHAAGDAVLKEIGQRLKKAYGKGAEITRLGGDEFCILFYKLQPDAEDVTKELQALIAQPITVEGLADKLKVTASIGFARFPEDGKTAENLMEAADKAMYTGKR